MKHMFFITFINLAFMSTMAFAQTVIAIDPADLSPEITPKNNLNRVLTVIRDIQNPIRRAARTFGISPSLVAAAIAGEHAMNVEIKDSAQNMAARAYIQADAWAQMNQDPSRNLSALIELPAYQECKQNSQDYDRWICIVDTWNRQSLGRALMGRRTFFIQFTSHFFNPNQFVDMGMTFGVGQMSPVRALMVDDYVARAGREPIDFWNKGDTARIFNKILNPNDVVYYIAATISYSIAIYKSGGFDISENPGVVATLYNIGNEKITLRRTLRENRLPETNDLGKWVNQNIDEIKKIVD